MNFVGQGNQYWRKKGTPIIGTLLVGMTVIFLKIKYAESSFKIYNLWLPFFILLWLAYEFITFAHYNVPSAERVSQLIKSIYFDGLISLLYPFIFSYIFIIVFAIFPVGKKQLTD